MGIVPDIGGFKEKISGAWRRLTHALLAFLDLIGL